MVRLIRPRRGRGGGGRCCSSCLSGVDDHELVLGDAMALRHLHTPTLQQQHRQEADRQTDHHRSSDEALATSAPMWWLDLVRRLEEHEAVSEAQVREVVVADGGGHGLAPGIAVGRAGTGAGAQVGALVHRHAHHGAAAATPDTASINSKGGRPTPGRQSVSQPVPAGRLLLPQSLTRGPCLSSPGSSTGWVGAEEAGPAASSCGCCCCRLLLLLGACPSCPPPWATRSTCSCGQEQPGN